MIVHTADVVDGEQLEDVVHTYRHFPIRLVVSELACATRELEEHPVVLIALQEWVVLIGERTPHALYGDVLAPLQLLYERYAVEQLAVHIPRH